MKLRIGFVSNSSSSSFVLDKSKLTAIQCDWIKNPTDAIKMIEKMDGIDAYARFGDIACAADWNVVEYVKTISGSTWMDNFDYIEFINYIGASKAFIKKESDGVWFDDESESRELPHKELTHEEWKEEMKQLLLEAGINVDDISVDDEQIVIKRKGKKK
jgi:hypothetical protein